MTKLTGIIKSENKLTGSLGVRNEINVDIIGTGARGKEGKSAYEIWLDLGNEGTEQEYLASLKGDDGHTPVRGTDYWTASDKVEIVSDVLDALPDGDEGDTGEQGVQGPKGDKGDTGEKGEKGTDGKDGHTPQKGVDYYTDADKAEMVSAILLALPVYEGEVESV